MQVEIPNRLFFRIGDVADILGVQPYVLRYWESQFRVIRPKKSQSGHRVYSKSDVEVALLVKRLLYEERYSIEGARKKLQELKSLPPVEVLEDHQNQGQDFREILQVASEIRSLCQKVTAILG